MPEKKELVTIISTLVMNGLLAQGAPGNKKELAKEAVDRAEALLDEVGSRTYGEAQG